MHPPDTTAPVLALPADITSEATSASGATVSFTVTATDAIDPTPTVACVPAPGSTFTIGTTTVHCTATDASGNASTRSFTVTVQDTTAPVVHVPSNITVGAGPGGTAVVTFSATATDNVDGSLTPACSPASGGTFGLGDTSVTCSATDASGNTGSNTFTVTVQDTTAPVVTVPSNITVGAGPGGTAVVTFSATATDNVDGSLTPACSPASGDTFGLGDTSVTCSATDAAGNTGSNTFTVTVN